LKRSDNTDNAITLGVKYVSTSLKRMLGQEIFYSWSKSYAFISRY